MNFLIGLAHRPIFHFFLHVLHAPFIGILFTSGLICAILKLNTYSYLYGYSWNGRAFILDIFISMLFIAAIYFISFPTILLIWHLGLSINVNNAMNTLFKRFSVLYMFKPSNGLKCINCALAGLENFSSHGKHCSKCGCAANNNPHHEIAE